MYKQNIIWVIYIHLRFQNCFRFSNPNKICILEKAGYRYLYRIPEGEPTRRLIRLISHIKTAQNKNDFFNQKKKRP